jgi:ABC-type transport system involved in multi-copper enzyme maturation permease subunit
MKKTRFMYSLTWELKNLFRFPFPEIMLALFTYITFLPRGGVFSFTVLQENLIWEAMTRKLAFYTIRDAAAFSFVAYLPMSLFASIIATLSFAYEIENGLMKVQLSHPTSRKNIFLSKLTSCFLIIFLTFSASLLAYSFFSIPENSLSMILSLDLILRMLLLVALETLFVTSLAVSFSLYSGKASVSLIGSFVTFYFIQVLSENANLEFLPPIAFRNQADFLFVSSTTRFADMTSLLAAPVASAVLILLSYVYFSRRMQVG